MKIVSVFLFSTILLLVNSGLFAQQVDLAKGDLSILKGETSINIEFVYDKMKIDDYGKEENFIKIKKAEKDAKEPGGGEKWLKEWEDDKHNKFEARFILRFGENGKIAFNKDSKYTLVFSTLYLEGGYSVGVAKKNAVIDAQAWIIETGKPDKKLAVFVIDRAPESMWRGAAFDSGDRISQAYMLAAKQLAIFIKKQTK